MRKIITVLAVLTGVLLYRIYKAGESIVLEQDLVRIGQRRQDNGNMVERVQEQAEPTWKSELQDAFLRGSRV